MKKNNSKDNELFDQEEKILENIDDVLKNENMSYEDLYSNYKKLAKSYYGLFRVTKKIFKISDINSSEVKRREVNYKVLLDNVNQGFLTVDNNLLIGKEYSKECNNIFGKKISNYNIYQLLSSLSKDYNKEHENILKQIFESHNSEKHKELINNLPNNIIINNKIINIEYKTVSDIHDNGDINLMLILTDITEKKKAEEEIMYLSFHDKLTGLYNRAYFEHIIKSLQEKENLPLSIIIGDVDGLKLVNDLFGHKIGDKLIKTIGKKIKSSLRSNDIICRWGGDEFIALLPNTTIQTAKYLCKKINKNCIEDNEFPLDLKISLGYATQESIKMSFSSLFNRADSVMYNNKYKSSKSKKKDMLLSVVEIYKRKCKKCFKQMQTNIELFQRLNLKDNLLNKSNILLLSLVTNNYLEQILEENINIKNNNCDKQYYIADNIESRVKLLQTLGEHELAYVFKQLNENWDGTGYPNGLKGNNISKITRVFVIIDYYSYLVICTGLDKNIALEEMNKLNGKRFDPSLFERFSYVINN